MLEARKHCVHLKISAKSIKEREAIIKKLVAAFQKYYPGIQNGLPGFWEFSIQRSLAEDTPELVYNPGFTSDGAVLEVIFGPSVKVDEQGVLCVYSALYTADQYMNDETCPEHATFKEGIFEWKPHPKVDMLRLTLEANKALLKDRAESLLKLLDEQSLTPQQQVLFDEKRLGLVVFASSILDVNTVYSRSDLAQIQDKSSEPVDQVQDQLLNWIADILRSIMQDINLNQFNTFRAFAYTVNMEGDQYKGNRQETVVSRDDPQAFDVLYQLIDCLSSTSKRTAVRDFAVMPAPAPVPPSDVMPAPVPAPAPAPASVPVDGDSFNPNGS
mgnify:CR=1 FL=1